MQANQDFSPDRAEASTARPIKSIGARMIHQMKTEQFTGKPPYSNPPYSTGLGSAWDKCCRAAAGPALVIVVEGVRS
jgi:hypothetical protein